MVGCRFSSKWSYCCVLLLLTILVLGIVCFACLPTGFFSRHRIDSQVRAQFLWSVDPDRADVGWSSPRRLPLDPERRFFLRTTPFLPVDNDSSSLLAVSVYDAYSASILDGMIINIEHDARWNLGWDAMSRVWFRDEAGHERCWTIRDDTGLVELDLGDCQDCVSPLSPPN